MSGDLSLGTMLAYFYTLTLVSGPVASLAGVTARAQRAAAAADRVFEIVDEPAEQPDPPGTPDLKVSRGEISFVDVGFSYASGPPVLADFSLVARPGETTALVGATGAGKSTVIALLQRFYEPAQGEIRIDGVAISKVGRASLRESLAVVQQDALLFEDTIRENIRYGRLDASDAEIATRRGSGARQRVRWPVRRRAGHDGRRARSAPVWWPAPADFHCARDPAQRPDPAARRGDIGP